MGDNRDLSLRHILSYTHYIWLIGSQNIEDASLFVLTHWLHLATIDLVADNREFKFEAYFEILYPL